MVNAQIEVSAIDSTRSASEGPSFNSFSVQTLESPVQGQCLALPTGQFPRVCKSSNGASGCGGRLGGLTGVLAGAGPLKKCVGGRRERPGKPRWGAGAGGPETPAGSPTEPGRPTA